MSPQTSEMFCSFQIRKKSSGFLRAEGGNGAPGRSGRCRRSQPTQVGRARETLALSLATAAQPRWCLALSYLSSAGLALT